MFSFDGENQEGVVYAKFSHRYTMGLGNYRGNAFTTGCWGYGSDCSSKVATEILDMTTLTWTRGPDYPFAPSE